MKSSKWMISVAFALFALLASAVAQTGAILISIPFNFTVGEQILPAGDYRVSIDGALLRVMPIDRGGGVFALTMRNGGGPNENLNPRLVFYNYGTHRVLSQAWIYQTGYELLASAADLEYARTDKHKQTVVLALR